MAVIYRAHPMFANGGFDYWYPPMGDDERFNVENFGLASLEGGDVEIIGNEHGLARVRRWAVHAQ